MSLYLFIKYISSRNYCRFLLSLFYYHLINMVVSINVSFAKVGAYFFIRHPVDGEFSLNILGNLWSTSFYEGRTNYVSLPTYPAASLI